MMISPVKAIVSSWDCYVFQGNLFDLVDEGVMPEERLGKLAHCRLIERKRSLLSLWNDPHFSGSRQNVSHEPSAPPNIDPPPAA
jgi:hypothetical protein